jgi:hypothetical protein
MHAVVWTALFDERVATSFRSPGRSHNYIPGGTHVPLRCLPYSPREADAARHRDMIERIEEKTNVYSEISIVKGGK